MAPIRPHFATGSTTNRAARGRGTQAGQRGSSSSSSTRGCGRTLSVARNLALERGLAAQIASLGDAAHALAESRRRLVAAEDTAHRRLEGELRRQMLPRLEPMPARIRSLAAAPPSDEGCAEVEHLVAETQHRAGSVA